MTETPGAWLIRIYEEERRSRYSVTVADGAALYRGVQEGDGVLIVGGGNELVVGFARIYRIRTGRDETTFFFDGFVTVEGTKTPFDLGVGTPESKTVVLRLEWPTFEAALKAVCGIEFVAFPVFKGQTPDERTYIRDLLQYAITDDLLGPADGPLEEIVGMSVRDRYLVGKLAPPDTSVSDDQVEELSDAATGDPEGAEREADASTSRSLVPSSFGFTFCVDGSVEAIELRVGWGRYERTESERIDERTGNPFRCWKRVTSGGTVAISLGRRIVEPIAVDGNCPAVVIQGTVGEPLSNGDRMVTLFLVNGQAKPDENQDQAWIFQPEMIARDPGGRAIFRRRPFLTEVGSDEERAALEMIYRRRVEFAVGHGVSVHATPAKDDPERAMEVLTCMLPQSEISVTETPGTFSEDRPAMRRLLADGSLDMVRLAEMERRDLLATLASLADDYVAWIGEQRSRIGTELVGHDAPAKAAMGRCESIQARLREGIAVLGSNDAALDAFRFANRAMASQRVRSEYSLVARREEYPDLAVFDVPEKRSWRPFQLAFILLAVPALADPSHRDRTEPLEAYADLLWFPTGGGKTEAYLGVAAFTMAVRRLQGDLGGFDGGRGLSVIMRYTLRLLTIQQFQRATTLICAMEVQRRAETAKWGGTPFTIGLWVGQRVTPNTTEESHEAIEREREGKYGVGSTPAQLTFCPWCGSEIVPGRDIRVDRDAGRTFLYCGDKYGRCEFGRTLSPSLGLPVLVVDDEIYRHPPSMLIATVDKFAMMAWRGQVRTLFGRAKRECPRHGILWSDADCNGNHRRKGALPATTVRAIAPIRPPDLIIQDEFHLIGGPLGTMVGLYETAVDELSSWTLEGHTVRPKVIASTATVRKAEEQVNDVFLRRVAVFPPHGIDVEDNFFSVQRPIEAKPGRRYMGVCSPGSSRPAVLIRVYVALLTAAQSLFERFGQGADPYMTLVGYFNSLRELGGMRRLAEDDVQTRSYRVQMSDVLRPGLSQRSIRNVDELTSRVSNKDIPKKLDQLEVNFKSVWARGETRAIDIVLATNMLSVGVDVKRLGLMVVNGQPKNTAEYIQATSRVGRFFPGLVCTVLTWSRPRDLSHYETFEHYHATFYKHVEAQSVTPFAPRALDRGLTGTMVSILRLESDTLNPNLGAQALDNSGSPEAAAVRKVVSERAWKVKDKAARQRTDSMAADRIDRWVNEAVKGGRRLGYETERRQGDVVALLKKPGATAWDEFTVPFSMREVEPGVRLVMDVVKLADSPPWRTRTRAAENEGGDA
jgi:hypothetical protein